MAEQTIKVGTEFTEIQIPQGDFTLFLNQNSKYFFVSRNSNGDDAIFSNESLSFTGPSTIYVKGDNSESYVILSDFFKTLPISEGNGNYTFDAPLNESVGNVSLNLASDLQVINRNLTLKLSGNSEFRDIANSIPPIEEKLQDLQYKVNKLTYPQFDAMEINLSPNEFKKGIFTLGQLPPSANGTIPLRNGTNLMTTFGVKKNDNYTDSDIAYNSQDGFFYIGRNNRLINLFTNNLLNAKLGEGKYTMQFTCEVISFGETWKQPCYIQVSGSFTNSATDSAFKDASNRLEIGTQVSSSPQTFSFFAYNWRGGTTETRQVALPNLQINTKMSGVAVFDGTTTTLYTRSSGETQYTRRGTMNATIPDGNNIRCIGFVRGNGDCASIKIYELRFWAGVALTEQEINGKLLAASMPI